MVCARCKVEVEVLIYPQTPGMEKCRMKRECPKCHCRIFSFISVAEEKSSGINLPLVKLADAQERRIVCERCQAFTTVAVFIREIGQLVCADCKKELEENAILAQLRGNLCI